MRGIRFMMGTSVCRFEAVVEGRGGLASDSCLMLESVGEEYTCTECLYEVLFYLLNKTANTTMRKFLSNGKYICV